MSYILLIVGMLLLVKGADWFVDGSASIAYMFNIPTVVVGLTIAALGTSLPELSVSLTASLAGSNELAISNVVGSNIFNTLMVVGTSVLIRPFIMDREIVRRDLVINILVTVLLFGFALTGKLSKISGIVFIAMLVFYLGMLISSTRKNQKSGQEEEKTILPLGKSLIFIVIGVSCIILGGNLVVNHATLLAHAWGWSETLIGLTIVSIGTSLPELVTSVVAANKGESGLSLGNALGSNIMNILFILGTSSILSGISVLHENIIDIIVLLAISILVFAMAKKSDEMNRSRGFLFVAAYIVYAIYILFR